MYWRDTVAVTGHGSQQFFGVFEAHAAAGQTPLNMQAPFAHGHTPAEKRN